jgi:hypothetical protein
MMWNRKLDDPSTTLQCQSCTPTGTQKLGSLQTQLQGNELGGFALKDSLTLVACNSMATTGGVDDPTMVAGASTTVGE